MAKITGIPPVPRGRYWERLLDGKIEPASDQDRQRLTAAGLSTWPIAFELHESGSRFAVPNAVMIDGKSDGDFIDVPATPYGNGVLIGPAVVISGTLIDNTGQKRYIYRKGVIAEDVNGEWNINSAMTGDVLPTGDNAGGNTPAGALTMNNVGVDVPSMAQHMAKADLAALQAAQLDLRIARATRAFFTLPTDPDMARRVLLTAELTDLGAALTPYGTGVYIEGDQQVRVRCNQRIAAGTYHVVEIGFQSLEINGPRGNNLIAAQALDENDDFLLTDQGITYNYLDVRQVPAANAGYSVHTYVLGWNVASGADPHKFDPYGTKFDLMLLLNSGGHYANKQIITHCRVYAAKEGDIVESTVESGWRVNKYAGGWKHSFLPNGGQSLWESWNP